MNYEIKDLDRENFPPLLKEIPDCPLKLRVAGEFPKEKNGQKIKYLAVIGSRKNSQYGKEVCEFLIDGLRGSPVCIVSGLALGIDSIAHRQALKSGIKTISIPGSGLSPEVLYPRSHLGLAKEIVESGGCLISEFEDNFSPTIYSFQQRNRVMAGLSDAVLVIEAFIKSGTLITSKLATEYNRDVLTVPQNIFSKTSEGPSMLIKLGATPVSKPEDILEVLGIETKKEAPALNEERFRELTEEEMQIVNILTEPKDKDEIIRLLKKPVHITQTLLSILEIKGVIKEYMGQIRIS